VNAQYRQTSDKYKEVMAEQKSYLEEEISLNPDVKYIIHPDMKLIYADTYHYEVPDIEDYRIGIIIDPVRMHIPNFFSFQSNYLIFYYSVAHYIIIVV
jgi:hypothetical protein